MKKFVLILLFGLGIFTFLPQSSKSQSIFINQVITQDSTIDPFDEPKATYSLKFSGEIRLHSDTSLVRVILLDELNYPYLIYEAYPLITASDTFYVTNGCDETCFLNGIAPQVIRIEIINATVVFDSLLWITEYIEFADSLQAESKRISDSVKVDIMNQEIQKYDMFWLAGLNKLSRSSYYEKQKLFPSKYNTIGFEYYIGGIFEYLSQRVVNNTTDDFVSAFDWRDRHGSNHPASIDVLWLPF